MIRLRGHHLWCLLGYRGMGYSEQYVANMTAVHQRLRTHPETGITIVDGPDDLCACFPEDRPNHCADVDVAVRDHAVLGLLGLRVDTSLQWDEVQQRVRERVTRGHLTEACQSCSWLAYGVCEEGLERIRQGQGLVRVVPEEMAPQ